MKKVFLGGTCNGSNWREALKKNLKIDYFDPVVPNWTPADQEKELTARKECDYILYVITPKMTGIYSIAEVVDDSNKRPSKTLFCVLLKDESDENLVFTKHQTSSLEATKKLVASNGANVFTSLSEIASFLNENHQ